MKLCYRLILCSRLHNILLAMEDVEMGKIDVIGAVLTLVDPDLSPCLLAGTF